MFFVLSRLRYMNKYIMATVLKKTLKDAARIAQAPTCADLLILRNSLKPILDEIIGGEFTVIYLEIDREKLFEQAIGFYKSSCKQRKHHRLCVTFKTQGHPEVGIDGSGLRREFYNLFFKKCLSHRDLFVGSPRKRFPSNDMEMIKNGCFEALGRAIVASILNGDCGFPYLAQAVFYYLIDEDYTPYLNLDDIPDENIKYFGKKLLGAQTDKEIIGIISEEDIIDHIGWPAGQQITLKTRHAFVEQLVQWSAIDKRKRSLDCLKSGLNHMNFLQATKSNPQLAPLLMYSSKYSVTSEYVQRKLIPLIKSIKCDTKSMEEARENMIQCINELKDEEASWLFQFITGSEDPPLEEEAIAVEINIHNPEQTLLEASTCSQTLRIPQGNNSQAAFRNSVRLSLEHARCGFGEA